MSQIGKYNKNHGLIRPGPMPPAPPRIRETWYIAVMPDNSPLWPYLELRHCDVAERLTNDRPHWKTDGWRIAKLQVREL